MSYKLVLFYVAASVVDSTYNILNLYSEDPFDLQYPQESLSGVQYKSEIGDDSYFFKNNKVFTDDNGFTDNPEFTNHQGSVYSPGLTNYQGSTNKPVFTNNQGSINNPIFRNHQESIDNPQINHSLGPNYKQIINDNRSIHREANYFEDERRSTSEFQSNGNVPRQENQYPPIAEFTKNAYFLPENNFRENSQNQGSKNINHQSGDRWFEILSSSSPDLTSRTHNSRFQRIQQPQLTNIPDEDRNSKPNYVYGKLDIQTGNFIPFPRTNFASVNPKVTYSRNQASHNTRGYNEQMISGVNYASERLKSAPQTAAAPSGNSLPITYFRQQRSEKQALGSDMNGSAGITKVNATLSGNFQPAMMYLNSDTVIYITKVKFTTKSPDKLPAIRRLKRTVHGGAPGADYQQLLKILLKGLGQGLTVQSQNGNKGQGGHGNNGQHDNDKLHFGGMSLFGHLLGGQQGIGLASLMAQNLGGLHGIKPSSLLSLTGNPLHGLLGQNLGGHKIKVHGIISPKNNTNPQSILGHSLLALG